MKTSPLALALLASAFSCAQAAELKVPSHVDAVTVYPQGADVVRLADVSAPPAESTLILDDLPGSVDPQSIRVQGLADGTLEVLSVDTKRVTVDEKALDAQRTKLSEEIEALSDERASLDQLIADKDAERRLLLSLAERSALPVTEKEPPKGLSAADLDNLVGSVASRLAATSKALQSAHVRQRGIDKEIAALTTKIGELAPEELEHLQVQVHVHADKDVRGKLRLSYRVPEASWHAYYDAKLALPRAGEEAKLSLIRRADVQQSTGESWADVALALSTAQPSAGAQAPDLGESEVSILNPMLRQRSDEQSQLENSTKPVQAMKDKKVDAVAGEADAPQPAPVTQRQAQVQLAGFSAQYVITDRVDIDNSGTSKKVRISTDDLSAKLSVLSVPRLDPHAYLTADFTAKADAPLLSGSVNLFRDDVYVGQSTIAELAAGENAKLGFGVDDLVKVKRTEVRRLAAEEGILTSSSTQEMGWIISVTNLHDIKMPVRIIDRKPFSSDAQIKVSDRNDNTPASVSDLDHKRGLLAWDLALAPKGLAEIKTGYKISAPKGVSVSFND